MDGVFTLGGRRRRKIKKGRKEGLRHDRPCPWEGRATEFLPPGKSGCWSKKREDAKRGSALGRRKRGGVFLFDRKNRMHRISNGWRVRSRPTKKLVGQGQRGSNQGMHELSKRNPNSEPSRVKKSKAGGPRQSAN